MSSAFESRYAVANSSSVEDLLLFDYTLNTLTSKECKISLEKNPHKAPSFPTYKMAVFFDFARHDVPIPQGFLGTGYCTTLQISDMKTNTYCDNNSYRPKAWARVKSWILERPQN